jgi:hypothetical protein
MQRKGLFLRVVRQHGGISAKLQIDSFTVNIFIPNQNCQMPKLQNNISPQMQGSHLQLSEVREDQESENVSPVTVNMFKVW